MDNAQINAMLLVMTNPIEGQEQEFNDWYTNIHLPEVVSLPGFIKARRFTTNLAEEEREPKFRYLALYEIEPGQLEYARSALADALITSQKAIAAGDDPVMSPATTLEDVRIVQWFEEIAQFPA